MRIAYFSPLPPRRTGIATYSRYLLPALARRHEVTAFHAGACDPVPGLGPPVDFTRDGALARTLERFDSVVYHLGNNPHYHLDIYRALLARPGVVVLHDTVLYFLMAGGGRGAFLREFAANYGAARLPETRAIEADCPEGNLLRYPHPARYPMLGRVLDKATGIVVHSETSAKSLRRGGHRVPVGVGTLIHYPGAMAAALARDARTSLREAGVPKARLVFGCFGFLGPTKRMASVLAALALVRRHVDAVLLVVGEGEDVMAAARNAGVADAVIHLGFAPDAQFDALLAAVDVVVNLRHPSMGEASATLVQAMAMARPCIVTRDAWFAELSADTVHFVSHGADEVAQLAEAMQALGTDGAARARLGAAARDWALASTSPEAGARRLSDLLVTFDKGDWARHMMAERVAAVVPR